MNDPEPKDDPETEPPSVSVNVHDVVERAAEIAAEEGHPAVITGDNVKEAFEEATK